MRQELARPARGEVLEAVALEASVAAEVSAAVALLVAGRSLRVNNILLLALEKR